MVPRHSATLEHLSWQGSLELELRSRGNPLPRSAGRGLRPPRGPLRAGAAALCLDAALLWGPRAGSNFSRRSRRPRQAPSLHFAPRARSGRPTRDSDPSAPQTQPASETPVRDSGPGRCKRGRAQKPNGGRGRPSAPQPRLQPAAPRGGHVGPARRLCARMRDSSGPPRAASNSSRLPQRAPPLHLSPRARTRRRRRGRQPRAPQHTAGLRNQVPARETFLVGPFLGGPPRRV